VAKALGVVLVLFQCPYSFRPTKENTARLRQFFERAKRGRFFMGWEPRGAWDPELVARLCQELDLIHVVDPFKSPPTVKGNIQYFRLHGISGARHRYTNLELQRLKEFCAGKEPAYCAFNTLAMAADAQRFAAMLGTSLPSAAH